MTTGPRFLALAAAVRRRPIRQWFPRIAGVRPAAAPAREPRTTAPRIRAMQFIGVVPPDVLAEKLR